MATDLCIVPRPVHIEHGEGRFVFKNNTVVGAPCVEHKVANYLVGLLQPPTGFNLPIRSGSGNITLYIDPNLSVDVGNEGYELTVDPKKVTLAAADDAGLFYGVQSLRQLLPAQIEKNKPVDIGEAGWSVPSVSIQDRPRFRWRGGHLDVGRHFFSVDFIKRFIDLLALHKQNVLHLHLTEDQGWRLEIKRYPRLTSVGAWRNNRGGKRYGGYYSQDEIREIVAYAQTRHVTIVPEIELPGHAQAALAAYPQFSCTGGPFEVGNYWGIYEDVFCAGNDNAINFLKNILHEVVDMFPGTFVHIGGDECPKNRWKKCKKCQTRIKSENLSDEQGLHRWMMRQLTKFLAEKDRRVIGWDEILECGLGPETAVMSWRSTEGGVAAARAGHDVVMCPRQHLFMDYKHYDAEDEPGRLGVTSLEQCYSFALDLPELNDRHSKNLLGVQANIWTEGIATPAEVEQQAWPRMSAAAEIGWTPRATRNFTDFVERMNGFLQHLDLLNVNYYRDEILFGDIARKLPLE